MLDCCWHAAPPTATPITPSPLWRQDGDNRPSKPTALPMPPPYPTLHASDDELPCDAGGAERSVLTHVARLATTRRFGGGGGAFRFGAGGGGAAPSSRSADGALGKELAPSHLSSSAATFCSFAIF